MLKIPRALISVLMIFCLCFPAYAAADQMTISDLIEDASVLDGTEVTIEGEVIGEALERDDYAWINVSDGTNAIGVWVLRSQITQIEYYGDYKHKGDTVRVSGVFRKACTEHGGDVDIHCTQIDIVGKGHTVREAISDSSIIAAGILLAVACAVTVVYIRLVKKPKESRIGK